TYNGQIPGPLLRLTAGRHAFFAIRNETHREEQICWHSQHATTLMAGRSWRGGEFTPQHAGLHDHHSDVGAATRLSGGSYNGQAGPLLIEPASHPGRFDREVVLVMKEFEPCLRRSACGGSIDYAVFTINGHMLGHGEPIKVRAGERVLFHLLN